MPSVNLNDGNAADAPRNSRDLAAKTAALKRVLVLVDALSNSDLPPAVASTEKGYEIYAEIEAEGKNGASQEYEIVASDAELRSLEDAIDDASVTEGVEDAATKTPNEATAGKSQIRAARKPAPVPDTTTVYVRGWLTNFHTSTLMIDDVEMTIDEFVSDPTLLAVEISEITDMELHIRGTSHPRSLCDIQDILHEFFKRISPGQIHNLNAHIKVIMPGDSARKAHYATLEPKLVSGHANQDMMMEFRDIMPGDLSRGHITAFLSDPIRMIRGLRDGKRVGKFTLKYDGASGNPWRAIQTSVRDLVRSKAHLQPLQEFCLFFEILRQIISNSEAFMDEQNEKTKNDFNAYLHGLAVARIKADVPEFHELYQRFSEFLSQLFNQRVDRSFTEESTIVLTLLDEAVPTLPDLDADVSFFGYNELDALLRQKKDNQKPKGRPKRKSEADVEEDEEDGEQDTGSVGNTTQVAPKKRLARNVASKKARWY